VVKVDEFYENKYGKVRVVSEVKGRDRCKYFVIEFQDKYRYSYTIRKDQLLRLSFKNPYYKFLFNLGYVGDGKYSSGKHRKYYDKWRDMIRRCYDEKIHSKSPHYIGCSVDPEWYSFQNFATWLDENKWNGIDQLDKDLIKEGNKLYSPKTCCLLPPELNSSLSHMFETGIRELKNGSWYARVRISKKSKAKSFKTYEKALKFYVVNKDIELQKMLKKYKVILNKDIYTILEMRINKWRRLNYDILQ